MTEEIANLYQIYDFRFSGRTATIDFSGKKLEIKYFVRTLEELKSFFKEIKFYRDEVKSIKKDLKFDKIWCRFDFGKSEISEDDLKKLIDFQKDIFDEVSIQKVGRNINIFRNVLDYAYSISTQPFSVVVDVKEKSQELMETLNLLENFTISNLRVVYGKFDTHLNKYTLIELKKNNLQIPLYLVGCNKRCSMKDLKNKNVRNVPVSIIARSWIFGFEGCCLDYNPVKFRKNKSGFPTSMDVFNLEKCLWEEHKHKKNFRDIRLMNWNNFNKLDISKQNLQNKKEVMIILNHLQNLKEKL